MHPGPGVRPRHRPCHHRAHPAGESERRMGRGVRSRALGCLGVRDRQPHAARIGNHVGASVTLPISTRSSPMVGAGTLSVRTSRRWHLSNGRRSCWKSVRDAWRRARYACGGSIEPESRRSLRDLDTRENGAWVDANLGRHVRTRRTDPGAGGVRPVRDGYRQPADRVADRSQETAGELVSRRLRRSWQQRRDRNGVSVRANSLSLNGGAIRLAGDFATKARLKHRRVAAARGRKVDGSRTASVP